VRAEHELTTAEVDALPPGTLVRVTRPGRPCMLLRMRRIDGALWGVTPTHGYLAVHLHDVGTAVTVQLVESAEARSGEMVSVAPAAPR